MNTIIYRDIENLLNGENGILMDLRYGDGLKEDKVDNLFKELDKISQDLRTSDNVPKSFFYLIIDSILVISSSVELNDDKSAVLEFLDTFTDKLKRW